MKTIKNLFPKESISTELIKINYKDTSYDFAVGMSPLGEVLTVKNIFPKGNDSTEELQMEFFDFPNRTIADAIGNLLFYQIPMYLSGYLQWDEFAEIRNNFSENQSTKVYKNKWTQDYYQLVDSKKESTDEILKKLSALVNIKLNRFSYDAKVTPYRLANETVLIEPIITSIYPFVEDEMNFHYQNEILLNTLALFPNEKHKKLLLQLLPSEESVYARSGIIGGLFPHTDEVVVKAVINNYYQNITKFPAKNVYQGDKELSSTVTYLSKINSEDVKLLMKDVIKRREVKSATYIFEKARDYLYQHGMTEDEYAASLPNLNSTDRDTNITFYKSLGLILEGYASLNKIKNLPTADVLINKIIEIAEKGHLHGPISENARIILAKIYHPNITPLLMKGLNHSNKEISVLFARIIGELNVWYPNLKFQSTPKMIKRIEELYFHNQNPDDYYPLSGSLQKLALKHGKKFNIKLWIEQINTGKKPYDGVIIMENVLKHYKIWNLDLVKAVLKLTAEHDGQLKAKFRLLGHLPRLLVERVARDMDVTLSPSDLEKIFAPKKENLKGSALGWYKYIKKITADRDNKNAKIIGNFSTTDLYLWKLKQLFKF